MNSHLPVAAWVGLAVRAIVLLVACSGSVADTWPANSIDQPVLHPAIPFLDEAGKHVLESGQPYSPRMTCGNGNGSGCHDYDKITHAYHFEMGRDEADDDLGKKRGWSHIVSPSWMGGFNCMSNAYLAAKSNPKGFVGDFGAAGMMANNYCSECHMGGGWAEKDRHGVRYDAMDPARIPLFDGDYYNQGFGPGNQVVRDQHGVMDSSVVSRWDLKKSGVREADCLMCHVDHAKLKKFDTRMGDNNHSNWPGYGRDMQSAFQFLRDFRNAYVIEQGFFREAATTTLEFLDLKPDTAEGLSLVKFDRTFKPGGEGDSLGYTLDQNEQGKPKLHWNKNAFDANGKVQVPMVRFPQNDTCLQCHRTRAYRGGFYGMGDDALPQIDAQGVIVPSHKHDVHAGRTFTDDNGQTRVIAGCTACHSRNYYKESFANVELDANHNFPKGTSDNDVRNDLDFRPGPKSCEFCHDQAKNRANPSGNIPILQVHRDLWKHNGDMAGYTADSLLKITQTHMDTVACQTCHIRKLKDPDDTDILTQYRYRRGEDGKNTIVPYTPYIRPYWIDKTSGHVLSRTEVDAIYAFKEKGDGYITSEVKDPETGKS